VYILAIKTTYHLYVGLSLFRRYVGRAGENQRLREWLFSVRRENAERKNVGGKIGSHVPEGTALYSHITTTTRKV